MRERPCLGRKHFTIFRVGWRSSLMIRRLLNTVIRTDQLRIHFCSSILMSFLLYTSIAGCGPSRLFGYQTGLGSLKVYKEMLANDRGTSWFLTDFEEISSYECRGRYPQKLWWIIPTNAEEGPLAELLWLKVEQRLHYADVLCDSSANRVTKSLII